MARAHALHVARIIFAGGYELVSGFDVFGVKDRRGIVPFSLFGDGQCGQCTLSNHPKGDIYG
jgi:hypothetical protein